MLRIDVPKSEGYNEVTNEYIELPGVTLILEHSLLSISKWESRWHKAFLGPEEKSDSELLDYIKCMIVNGDRQELSKYVNYLTQKNLDDINAYINDPMTATHINSIPGSGNGAIDNSVKTSEVIYYLMISYGIPFECQKWHISRLLTLIKVCEVKNAPPKKMSPQEIAKFQSEQNALRCRKYGTKG